MRKQILVNALTVAVVALLLAGAGVRTPPSTAQVSSPYARRLAPSTFANLGTPPNGSVRYCSNCAATSPCTGAGSGAQASRVNGAWNCSNGGSGTGDVVGPNSSADNALARYDSTTGKVIQNSGVTVDDSGFLSGPAQANLFGGATVSVDGYASINGEIFAIGNPVSSSVRVLFEAGVQHKTVFGSDQVIGFGNIASGTASNLRSSLDVALGRSAAGVLFLSDGSTGGGAFELTEIADPSAPDSNKARLYVKDNGSGKSQLVVRFASGAVQAIATEP